MTCLSTLRRVWPVSLCVNYDSDEEQWPPPWPKMSDTDQHNGYTSQTPNQPNMSYGQPSPMTEQPRSYRTRTAKDRAPPVPSLPEQYYGLPPNSRAQSRAQSPESRKGRSRSRSQSRNRIVKPRTQSLSSSRSRPSIGAPSDFRKVAGHDLPRPRVPPMPVPQNPQNPPADSWRRMSRRMSRRVSRMRMGYRPLELTIHQPGNELKPLPRFSRVILDPAETAHLTEFAARPASTVRMPTSRTRRSLTRSLSRRGSPPRATATPKMPFARDSTSSEGSDISFDDLESVVDPDFNPAPRKQNRTSRHFCHKKQADAKMIEHIRPPVPLKTRSLLPSPREEKTPVSPVSPPTLGQTLKPHSFNVDDLPSAFSSPASPSAAYRESSDPFRNLDAAVAATHDDGRSGSIPYTHNNTNKVSTPDRSLNPQSFSNSPPRETPMRQSPTPSNASTASTTMSHRSASNRSVSTAATGPPSPLFDTKKHALQNSPPQQKPPMMGPLTSAPHTAPFREMTVQRVVADAPLLQPAPRLGKSSNRFLPMIEEAQSPTDSLVLHPQHTQGAKGPGNMMPPMLQKAYGPTQLPQRPAPVAKPVGAQGPQQHQRSPQPPQQFRPQQQQQQQQQQQRSPSQMQQFSPQPQQQSPPQKRVPPPRPARPEEPSQLPQPPEPPVVKPHLQLQTPDTKRDWTHTGSAWREVVWGLKRRTQEEMALRQREQQVVIETAGETASAHSEDAETWRQREQQFAMASQPNGRPRAAPPSNKSPAHFRGGSNGAAGSAGSSHHHRGGSAGSGNGSGSGETMEVPVGLALSGLDPSAGPGPQRPSPPPASAPAPLASRKMMPYPAAAQSNDALLHLQPSVTHDMHAIAEEDEEDEAQPAPKPMLSVVNGMPSQLESDSEDNADGDSDSEDGEEVEFGLDDAVWEMVESAPVSTHASLADVSRASVAAVTPPARSATSSVSSGSGRASRGSMYIPSGSSSGRTSQADPDAPPMPTLPRGISETDLQFPVPPSSARPAPAPKAPAAATAPKAGEQWGKGLGVEFGIAY